MPWDAKMCAALRRQDMLYTLVMQDAEASTARVVEAITEFVFVPEDGAAFEALAVDARLKIVSLTVTEKGYYQDVATGDLDLGAALVARDVDDWRSAGRLEKPRTAFGFICAVLHCVLQRRRSAGLPAVTVLSCDNLPLNGDLCKRSTLRFAAACDADLAAWIAAAATFPNSMVDRITPATEDAHRAQLADEFGVRDAWPVVSERFAQWVVEDAFVAGRPDWDRGFGGGDDDESVLFVGDVEPYETMKLRLLNSGHSALAAVGLLLGHRLVHASLADPDVAGFLAAYMRQVAATLGPVPGVDIEAYQTKLVARFKNPKIADTLARLASDGSQKFNSTLAHALRAMRAADEAAPPPRVALALACFLLSFAEVDEMGQRFALADPRRDALAASGRGWLLRHALDAADATEMRTFLGLVFGDDVAAWDALVAATHAVAADVRARGLRAVLREP
ncbi:mannitol 2-dehydrogenase [Aureococcus anophagefferens]|nr:mannitol 2-dehydrogenase [Aureococcus anophagefferens]